MNIKEVQNFLDPQFGFLGKSNGEQLWMHHYTVWSVFKKFVSYVPSIDEKEEKFMEVACLMHDIAKRSEKNQRILIGEEEGKLVHKSTLDEVREYLKLVENSLPFPPTEENIKIIFDIIVTHHSISEEDLRGITTDSAGILTELLRYADWLASMESISPRRINEIRKATRGLFDLTYFEISRFSSPTTYLMLEEGIKEYKEEGWELLLAFEDGALFLGEGYKIPEKEEIVDNVLKSFFDRSLGIQPVYSPNFTNRFLGGLSELFPTKFMKIGNHEQVIKDNLGDITKKGVQFFRLLYDLLSLDEREFSKIKKEMLRWELIPSCLGKSGHKKVKEFLWTKHFNEKSPNSINTDVINKLPEKMKVKEVVPKTYEVSEIDFDKYLSKLTPEELFSILYTIAEQKEITETETFKKYLKDTISLEEVKDFKNVAQEIFERYKTYKRTTDAAIGICERCGCPVSIIAGPALKYPKSKTFTQIKSKPTAYKSTCPFCAYDNMILREDLRGNDLRIFVRIESKIPEIIKTYLELDRLVTTLRNGLEYPCQILKLEEREELKDLPFPKRMSIPVAREDYSKAEKLLSTERGTLFGVERLRMEKFSPKDHRVKYEPLYHALNLLGFHTNIGAEEQVGLFGENLITTKSEYYKSLAVIILANVLAKDQNKYIFAKNLLEQSPSVALRFASETQKGTNNPRMQEELAGRFYTFIHKSGIILFRVSGGEYGMKDLLKDAAFFADKDWGIPHFCVEPEDRGDFWRDLTRHKAAKPVSDALNEMLQGNEEGAFQRAIAAFMNNLSKKISGEEKEKQNEFMERTIKILEKFWELRERDISEFIRYKNAFTSTIFVFTRYPNLKEVTK